MALLGYVGCSEDSSITFQDDQEFVAQAPYNSWSFGVIADTQWTVGDDGFNPNSVAVGIIRQIDQKFIEQNVRFVIQVGDLTDLGWRSDIGKKAIDTRALFAQELYNHGIGFYPIRGNHEASPEAATEFTRVFSQTRDGLQNATPADVLSMDNPDNATQPSPVCTGVQFSIGNNFNSPNSELSGLSYSFDYENARFIFLDNFPTADNTTFSINEQLPWVKNQLSSRPENIHPFVFTHYDFGAMFNADDLDSENRFITCMYDNSARYLISGHAHQHTNAAFLDTNGDSYIHNLICAGASSKFYGIGPVADPNPYPFTYVASEEVSTIGYYIFTITGPNVTIDYYSAQVNLYRISGGFQITVTPELNFTKRETFGYSLAGKEFVIEQGQAYEAVSDSYSSHPGAPPTYARIFGGINGSSAISHCGFSFKKTVNTGWSPMIESTSSDILTIWGMHVLNDQQSDLYALSLSYYPTRADMEAILNGQFGIITRDTAGKWLNASTVNDGGAPTFILGPWYPSYGLGTYGVDVFTDTAWAVLNFSGEFAVARIQ
jgi:hypothetical protein